MKIACLGWGSLVWDPQTLPVRTPWFQDGPLLPIEFARQSMDDRITLVIVPEDTVAAVRSLWALMSIDDLAEAKKELANREGIKEDNIDKYIGSWPCGVDSDCKVSAKIEKWAASKDLDAVIWTALSPKFQNTNNCFPTPDQVLAHLNDLPYEKRRHAEEYIRKAPRQIDTEYRRRIERKFGWTVDQ